jgi:hypothetical protein
MALDEVVTENVAALGTWVGTTFRRWAAAALAIRANTYQPANLWVDLTAQVRDNWNTLDEVARFGGFPATPTVVIRGANGAMTGQVGTAFVGRHLDAGNLTCTAADQFGGAGSINAASFALAASGDLMGKLVVTLNAEPAVGIYRGMVLHKATAPEKAVPVAWIVVNVE